jgi:hypothetical protein
VLSIETYDFVRESIAFGLILRMRLFMIFSTRTSCSKSSLVIEKQSQVRNSSQSAGFRSDVQIAYEARPVQLREFFGFEVPRFLNTLYPKVFRIVFQ